MTLIDVRFLRESLAALLPAQSAGTADNKKRNAGGRPPAPFNDDLMCAIWALIYQGDLKPARQADIENAIKDWVINQGHEIGDTAAREKAKKIWTALQTDVENPAT
jgi:hypothetical protein